MNGTQRVPTVVVEPPKRLAPLRLRESWEYRELLWTFVARNLRVRYKQTELGIAWAVIQPLFMMLLFTIFFGRLAKVPSPGVPYPINTYVALVPWTYFANALSQTGNSLVDSAALLTKVYFPRMLLPLSAALTGLVDLGISFVLLIVLMLIFQIAPTVYTLLLPLLVLLALMCALSAGIWLAALNVEYRDVKHLLPFLTQAWLFASPVAYPLSLVPERWQPLYALNPMVGVIEGFRWAILGTVPFPGWELLLSVCVVAVLLYSGLLYFRRMERTFADVV